MKKLNIIITRSTYVVTDVSARNWFLYINIYYQNFWVKSHSIYGNFLFRIANFKIVSGMATTTAEVT